MVLVTCGTTGEHLTLGSLFDGSGGFPLGGLISGVTPVWASEIEPFPIRVTTKRLPFMKHYGDVSALSGADLEPVDIITFGSPCQDMSVAGRRAGLDGSRSNLFYEAVRIAKEMREATNGRYPTWLCWENVPGAFSSNSGSDFKAVLDEIRKIKDPEADTPRPARWPNAGCILADDHSVAWRVFDAQYWGVPQRRKRIYLVADLAGQRAGKVLFESEGVSGYTPQGFRSWQGSAGTAEEGAHPAGVGAVSFIAVENHPTDSRVTVSEDGKVQTLTSRMGTGGNNVPLVLKIRCGCEGGGKGPLIQTDKSATFATNNDQTVFVPTVYGICAKDSNAMKSDNPNSGFYKAETTRTLDANGGNHVCNQGGMAVVAVQGSIYKGQPIITEDPYYIVRRLTPTECARLQGFPDWWCAGLGTDEPTEEDLSFWREVFETHRQVTGSAVKPKTDAQLVKWLKNPHTDSAEYKMWGNGVALPCVHFVLAGITFWAGKDKT